MSVEYRTGTVASTDALFLALDDLLTDNGWTQHDIINSSAGTYDTVYRSPAALDATAGNYAYIRLTRSSGENLSWRTYCDWDTSAHAGMFAAGQNGSSQSASSFTYWARVNDFALAVGTKVSGTYYRGYLGFTRRGYKASKAGITKTSSGYSSGVNSMSVASDMTSKLKTGQKVTIINNAHNNSSANKENAEVLTINTISSSTITFTTNTTKAYDTGAVIGANPTPCLSLPLSNNAPFNTGFTGLWPMTGEVSGVTSQQVVTGRINMANENDESRVDPSDGYLEYLGGLVTGVWTSSTRTGFAGYLYHWESCSYGSQSNEDVMSDGDNTFIILYNDGSSFAIMLGPQ